MKGRLLITWLVLAIAAAACAESNVVEGDGVLQESESVSDGTVTGGQQTNEVATEDGAATEPETASARTPSGEEAPDEEPGTDPDDQTTSTTGDDTPLVTNPPKQTPSTTTTTKPTEGNPGIYPGLLPLVDQAKTDLAGRLIVDLDAIGVISAELVEWPDTSLGCPQPGMAYTQVPTDGSLIILTYGGVEYHYHTGGSASTPFLCE